MLQKFYALKEKYDKLMTGRYAIFDTLNKDIMTLWAVIAFINMFFKNIVVRVVLPLLPILAVLRMFSKNEIKRSNENRKYLSFREKIVEFFKIQVKRVKEYKTHRYYKCKNCGAYIRVPAKKGKHRIDCPKCGKEFDVRVL